MNLSYCCIFTKLANVLQFIHCMGPMIKIGVPPNSLVTDLIHDHRDITSKLIDNILPSLWSSLLTVAGWLN